jgi:hypothetical protein
MASERVTEAMVGLRSIAGDEQIDPSVRRLAEYCDSIFSELTEIPDGFQQLLKRLDDQSVAKD